jgi:hypothetical protein
MIIKSSPGHLLDILLHRFRVHFAVLRVAVDQGAGKREQGPGVNAMIVIFVNFHQIFVNFFPNFVNWYKIFCN